MGGIAYTPYLAPQAASPQESLTTSGGATSSKSSSPEKISGTIKKEIIDLLKENGIPSDVTTFLNAANTFLSKSQSLSGMSLFGGTDDDYDLTDLIKVQQMVNDVKYNNALKDAAAKQLTEQMAGSEVALTDNGHLYVQDKDGKITTVSPEKYAKDKESYTPLTNNQLLYYREHDPGFAFNTGVLNDLRNTVGMKTITDYLKNQITAFGNDEKGGYAAKDNPVVRGMELLMAAGPDGYYKFKDSSQLRDVNAAIKYLYEGLTPNAKNLLRGKTAADGGDPNKMGDVCDLILQALQIFPDKTQTVDFDKSATEYDPSQTGKKGGSGSEQLTQDNYLQQIGNKRLYRTEAAVVPMASQVWETGAMVMPVYTAGAPIDRQGDVLGKMSLSEFREKAVATKAGDMSSITFGNRVLIGNETDKVMYDGASEINIAMLPYKHDSNTGQLTPDFSALQKFNEIQRFLKDHPGASEMEIAAKARDLGVDWNKLGYDRETNSITIKDTMPFITFSAYVGGDAFNIPKDMKPYLEHVQNSVARPMLQAYNNVMNYGKANPSKSDRKINNFNTPERWDFYKGNVYVPMENAARAMLLSGIGEFVPKSQMTDFAARVTAREMEVAQTRMLQEQDPNYNLVSSQLGKF